MEEWLRISLILCLFGFLKEIRPSEPFVYEFMIDQRWRNVTEEQVQQNVYPVGTYSYFAQLVVIFLITDLCRYKPLIILLGLSGIVVWSMLIWTTDLLSLQILEVFYGTFMATEVAYYTYIYAKVDTDYFQKVTSHTRAAILAGRAISGILAQLLISFKLMNTLELNYISLAALICATFWAIFLPPAKKSIYFHQKNLIQPSPPQQPNTTRSPRLKSAFTLMRFHFVDAFSNKYVLKWSFWWALATCGFIQVQSYMQPLWSTIQQDNEGDANIYNGAVEAVLTVLGFLGALLAGVLKVDWSVKGELFLAISTLLCGFVLLFASQTNYIMLAYACYVAFGALYHIMITVASTEVARFIKNDSYGLVFGFNTLLALLLQTILTAVVVTKNVGFALGPRDQYFVYGIYHVVIAVFYIVIGLASWIANKTDHRKPSIILSL